MYFCVVVVVVGKYMHVVGKYLHVVGNYLHVEGKYLHQLSNDLGLFFPTEEAGEEASCEHVVDVLEEPLRRKS